MVGEASRNELVLAQNQYAFIQDETKGAVEVIVGPQKLGLTQAHRPVRYDPITRRFDQVNLNDAISQNVVAGEDSYVVLENPARDEKSFPSTGSGSLVPLQVGRKINIPGPVSFALWPGMCASSIKGHQMKSNEYIFVRVYNVEEATKNWPTDALAKPDEIIIGQMLSIQGVDVSFFIPPTGLEVVPEPGTVNYVRKAVTLEQLEYVILLDENGTKRYERGPKVVFPAPTETFFKRKKDSATAHTQTTESISDVKFKATDLNDQMGVHIKVIEDYVEKAVEYKVGQELFITGKEQRIYYPRKEHAIIEYSSGKDSFQRQRHYAIAIPKGKGRYVLNKTKGQIELVEGETMFLPNPIDQVIVRRILDPRTCELWYPGNTEALEYNEHLSSIERKAGFIEESSYEAAGSVGTDRSMNRMTARSTTAISSTIEGDTLKRGSSYTPPRAITLNDKYEGPPSIQIWTGYAVQIVDKSGNRRVVEGPDNVLLEYDETMEKLTLSAGNPKTTDNLFHTAYLRVDHNKVSDTVSVETKDMVNVNLKLSYRVDFEGDSSKWFAVENYIKFFTDHCRSVLRGECKKYSLKQLLDNNTALIRDSILGVKPAATEKEPSPAGRKGMFFEENNMRIKDVEVLKLSIPDPSIESIVANSQKSAVTASLMVTTKQQELENAKTTTAIDLQLAELKTQEALKKTALERMKTEASAQSKLASIQDEYSFQKTMHENQLLIEQAQSMEFAEQFKRRVTAETQDIAVIAHGTETFVKRMGTIDPKLTDALTRLADTEMLEKVTSAFGPIAVMEHEGIGPTFRKLMSGTSLASRLEGVFDKSSTAKSSS